MPIKDIYGEYNIYDEVIIILQSDKTFSIKNCLTNSYIAAKIASADTALAIKKAYCDGYYDGSRADKR